MVIGTKGPGRWRSWAGAWVAVAATLGWLIGASPHVAAASSPSHAITVIPVTRPDFGGGKPLVNDVESAPDGTLWFIWELGADPSQSSYGLGTVDRAGHLGTFTVPRGWTLNGLVAQDGFEWVTESHDGSQYIGQWTPAGTLGREFPVPGGALRGITFGHDSALWFTGGSAADTCGLQGGFIGRMSTTGAVTTFALPGSGDNGAHDIAANDDGSIWFDLPKQASVGRLSPSGTVSLFALPGAQSQCDFVSDEDLAQGSGGSEWVGSMWSGGVRQVALDGTVTATYPVSNLFSLAGFGGAVAVTTAFSGSVEWLGTDGTMVLSWPLDSGYPAGAPLITTAWSGSLWIGVQGAIELLDTVAPPPKPTPTPSTSGGDAGGGGAGRSASPSSGAGSTPVPGFLTVTPTPSPGAGALASAHGNPSSGSGLAIVLGVVAAVVLLASGTAGIVIRRRHTTATTAPPTP